MGNDAKKGRSVGHQRKNSPFFREIQLLKEGK